MSTIQFIQNIPFQQLENIPQLIKDFMDKKLSNFEEEVFELSKVETKVKAKINSISSAQREVVHSVISSQLSPYHLSESQQENLRSLLSENTFTIVTGHQLNLFSGPAFFVYKILQTIKLAEVLKEKYKAYQFVPVFWMATEDHDFEEINHFNTENDFYEISGKSGGVVGKIKIEENSFIKDFEKEFEGTNFGEELILLIKKSYQKGNTLTEATQILVQQLFSEYGLLFLDGDNAQLKSAMIPLFKNEILYNEVFETTKETIHFLTEKYGKVQVNPRKINLFYLSETRNRIEKRGERYHIVDTSRSFSEAEILKEVEKAPEKFSPNALLRPVFQEWILPNIAYIGGNAEVSYWLELKDYFKKINLPIPFIIPRNSLVFIQEKKLEKVRKLGFVPADLFGNFPNILKEKILKGNEILEAINTNEKVMKANFNELSEISSKTNATFKNLVQAEETRQLKSFDRMRKRLLRAERIQQKDQLERAENLYQKIHPQNKWQERVFNFSVFYSEFGKEWIKRSYEQMDVEKSQLILFSI